VNEALGVAEVAVVVGILAFLGGVSLSFTHIHSKEGVPIKAGRGPRTFFAVAAWVTSLGAIIGWLLVLGELALGPISPVNPWVLGVAFGLAAPPVGQMYRSLKSPEA
jgi:hypothetical protein